VLLSLVLEHGLLAASVFRFASGVCGLRLKNELGALTPEAAQDLAAKIAKMLGN